MGPSTGPSRPVALHIVYARFAELSGRRASGSQDNIDLTSIFLVCKLDNTVHYAALGNHLRLVTEGPPQLSSSH